MKININDIKQMVNEALMYIIEAKTPKELYVNPKIGSSEFRNNPLIFRPVIIGNIYMKYYKIAKAWKLGTEYQQLLNSNIDDSDMRLREIETEYKKFIEPLEPIEKIKRTLSTMNTNRDKEFAQKFLAMSEEERKDWCWNHYQEEHQEKREGSISDRDEEGEGLVDRRREQFQKDSIKREKRNKENRMFVGLTDFYVQGSRGAFSNSEMKNLLSNFNYECPFDPNIFDEDLPVIYLSYGNNFDANSIMRGMEKARKRLLYIQKRARVMGVDIWSESNFNKKNEDSELCVQDDYTRSSMPFNVETAQRIGEIADERYNKNNDKDLYWVFYLALNHNAIPNHININFRYR